MADTAKKALMDMTRAEVAELMASLGEPRFRTEQVMRWLRIGVRPAEMTDLSKKLRAALGEMPFGGAEIYKTFVSGKDGTKKYLFALEDGNIVEGVFMIYRYGNTLCLSSQVGCRMGCAFCASTLEGCVRDLTAGEMLSMVACAEGDNPAGDGRAVTNIVLMGSGEPLDNLDNMVEFLNRVTAPEGMNISQRNISVSTCGLVPRLYEFMERAPRVTLSVSLHAPNDALRSRIMPVNRRYSVSMLVKAARDYVEKTGRRVVFEYALIKDFNDGAEQALELAHLLRGIICHVNLIPMNEVAETGLTGVSRREAEEFCERLKSLGLSATVRREMGDDIQGACGQLRRKVLGNE